MRNDWCSQHVEEIIQNCGLGDDVVSKLRRATKFKKIILLS